VAPFKANPQKMLDLFKKGYTIKYDKLHQTYPPLASKVSFLENEIGLKIRTSLYITPENSQGYGVHTDRHDVLALQLNGTKIWKVKLSSEILPSKYDGKILTNNWEDGAQEIHLKAGDFFYCPRGLAHDVYTKDDSSVHYTLGFQPMYGYKAVEYITELAYENSFFRKALPNKLCSESQKENFEKEFKEEFKKFIDGIDVKAMLDKKSKESTSSLIEFKEYRFSSQFYQPNASDIFTVNQNIAWQLSFTKVSCRIEIDGAASDFPFLLKDFLESIKQKEKVSLADLPSAFNLVQKTKVMKRLLRIGILSMS
jgi:ribosomal protein L16 Arg81 hydroxylase